MESLNRLSIKFQNSTWVFFLLTFVIAFLISGFHSFFPVTSAWDEQSHLSYIQYVFNWKLPHEGDPLNSWGMAAFSCHLHQFYGVMTGVPCGEIGTPGQYPAGGNTAAFWPPLYYIIAATLMRIPLIFVGDPLIAARIATALIWSLGVSCLSVLVYKKTNRLLLSVSFTMIAVSVPAFTQFSSYVSPHSLNPFLVAMGLFVSDRYINKLANSHELQSNKYFPFWPSTFLNRWFFWFLMFGGICAISIPHSISIVLIFGLYIIINGWTISSRSINLKLRFSGALIQIIGTILPFAFVTAIWQVVYKLRTLPIPALPPLTENNLPSDSPKSVHDLMSLVVSRFFEFWPGAFQAEWPSGEFASFVQSYWLNIFVACSIGAIIFWNSRNWISPLMIAVMLVAPAMAVAFDLFFSFPVPKRYALGIALIGTLSIVTTAIPRLMGRLIFASALLTYLLSFLLDPLKVDITKCAGTGSEIICRLFF